MSTDILTCITENDKESFKKLFCERSQNIPGFDEQVDAMFEYCNSTVCFTDSTIKTIASGGSSTQKGESVEWYVNSENPYFEVLSEPGPDEEQSNYFSVMGARIRVAKTNGEILPDKDNVPYSVIAAAEPFKRFS